MVDSDFVVRLTLADERSLQDAMDLVFRLHAHEFTKDEFVALVNAWIKIRKAATAELDSRP